MLALRRQVLVLKRQIKRVKWAPADRMVLAALRERLPRSAWAALRVQPETVLGWHRDLVRRQWAAYRDRPSTGRPPLSEECRELIVRMARENSRWGYFRIRGELLKLGYTVSATTIRSILRRAHVPPAGRRSELTWKQFLAAHAETLVATDFFSVDTVFFKRLYVLMFVHVGTRRVLAAACTDQPDSSLGDSAGSESQLAARGGGDPPQPPDRRSRSEVPWQTSTAFRVRRGRVVLTPLMAPRANAHAERWIGELPAGMPGLDADRLGEPPAARAARVLRALQR